MATPKSKTTLHQAHEVGQSIWYDNMRRGLLRSGALRELVEKGVRGLTSNPTIFEKAIVASSDYEEALKQLTAEKKSTPEIYEALVIEDIRGACDLLLPVYEESKGVDGRVSLGLNPDGPTDRQIGLIRLERPDGAAIAVIANYAMHGTVLSGSNLEISGDAPGTVSAYVEQKVGAPVLYVNGAAGNLAPIYSVYPTPAKGHLSQFNVLLGDRILTALGAMGAGTNEVSLWLGEKMIETPRKEGLVWTEDLAKYSATGAGGRPLVRLPVRFLRVNDTVIWSAPIELFCEIAIAVRDRSPFPRTFYFGYTGGWFGYLPTKQGFLEGGYEPKTSPFSESAEKDLSEGVITLLQGLRR